MNDKAKRSENNPELLSLAKLGTQPGALLHLTLPATRIRVFQHQRSSKYINSRDPLLAQPQLFCPLLAPKIRVTDGPWQSFHNL